MTKELQIGLDEGARKIKKLSRNGKWSLLRSMIHAICAQKNEEGKNTIDFGNIIDFEWEATPLAWAIHYNDADTVSLLIEYQPTLIKICDKRGWTAFHELARLKKNNNLENIFYSLIRDCEPSIINIREKEYKRTALHMAIYVNNHNLVKLLIDHNADVSMRDKYGFTALHLAIKHNRNQIAETLINYYSDDSLNTLDENGYTMLHWAVIYGRLKAVKILLSRKINLYKKDRNSDTTLHLTSLYNRPMIAKALITKDRKVLEIQDVDGSTALHLAVHEKAYNVAKILADNGADLYKNDSSGRNPLHWATFFGYSKIVKSFVKKDYKILWANDKKGQKAYDLLSPPLPKIFSGNKAETRKYLNKILATHEVTAVHEAAEILMQEDFPEFLSTLIVQIARNTLVSPITRSTNNSSKKLTEYNS